MVLVDRRWAVLLVLVVVPMVSACSPDSTASVRRPRIDVVAEHVDARTVAVHDGFVYWGNGTSLWRRSVHGGKASVLGRFDDGVVIESIAFGCGHAFVGVAGDGVHRLGSGRMGSARIATSAAPHHLRVVDAQVVFWDETMRVVDCDAPAVVPRALNARFGLSTALRVADDAIIALSGSTLVEIDGDTGNQRELLHTLAAGALATHGRHVFWGDAWLGAVVRIDRDGSGVDVVVDGFVEGSTFVVADDELYLAGPGAMHVVDLESLHTRTSPGALPRSFRRMAMVADPDARELYAAFDHGRGRGRVVRVVLDDLGEPRPRPSWLTRGRIAFRPDGSHDSAMGWLQRWRSRLLRDAIEAGRVDIMLEGHGPDGELARQNAMAIRAQQLARLPRTRIQITTRESPVEEVVVRLRAVNVADALRVDTERRFVPELHVSSECARWVVGLRNPSEHLPDEIRAAGPGIHWDLPYVRESEAFESECRPLQHELTEPLRVRFTARLPHETVDETQVLRAPRGEPRRFVWDPNEPVVHHAPYHRH